LLIASPAAAQEQPEPSSGSGFAALGSAVCSLVYSPLKIAYAASGIVVGSLAWVWSFGSRAVARPIFRAALRGDYVVTPGHLRGQQRLRFVGGR
jgi:hypothetical protein